MINLPYRNLLTVSLLFYSCAGTQPGWTYQLEDDPQYIQGVGQVTRSKKLNIKNPTQLRKTGLEYV